MTVSAHEFIRRFLIHILPHRFMKIRHYGFLGNRNKSTKLVICKKLTNTPICPFVRASTNELILKIIGKDISRCPQCGFTQTQTESECWKSSTAVCSNCITFISLPVLGRGKLYLFYCNIQFLQYFCI